MRHRLRCVVVIVVLLAGWAAPAPLALAASLDATADRVLGHATFGGHASNAGGLSAASLFSPQQMAIDPRGNLYVADFDNHSVLEYDAPLTTHQSANRVFGQPGFATGVANHGGLNASSLTRAAGVALHRQGNLYVADFDNNRVL